MNWKKKTTSRRLLRRARRHRETEKTKNLILGPPLARPSFLTGKGVTISPDPMMAEALERTGREFVYEGANKRRLTRFLESLLLLRVKRKLGWARKRGVSKEKKSQEPLLKRGRCPPPEEARLYRLQIKRNHSG